VGKDGRTPNEVCCACGGGSDPIGADQEEASAQDTNNGSVVGAVPHDIFLGDPSVSSVPPSPAPTHISVRSAQSGQPSLSGSSTNSSISTHATSQISSPTVEAGEYTVNTTVAKQTNYGETGNEPVNEPVSFDAEKTDNGLESGHISASVGWKNKFPIVVATAMIAFVVGL